MTDNEMWEHAWRLLARGVADKKHAFNLATVATVAGQHPAVPRSRTLVLRGQNMKQGSLTCYTDHRSDKISNLENSGGVMSWCFWDRKSRLQFTGHGLTTIDTERSATVFSSLPKHSRKAYATTKAPGTPLPHPTDGLPDDWEDRSREETEYAASNFVVLTTVLTYVEILQLDREGHRRLRATRVAVEDAWSFQWIVP